MQYTEMRIVDTTNSKQIHVSNYSRKDEAIQYAIKYIKMHYSQIHHSIKDIKMESVEKALANLGPIKVEFKTIEVGNRK